MSSTRHPQWLTAPRLALAVTVALTLALPMAAAAQGLGVSVFATSDKLLRGTSQSDGQPVVGLDTSWRGDTGWSLAAGLAGPTWPRQYTSSELTLAASRSWQHGHDLSSQWGVVRYQYLGSQRALDRSYTELNLALGWRERASVSLGLMPDLRSYGPPPTDGPRPRGLGIATELNWRQPLAGRWNPALDLGLGHLDLQRIQGRSYRYASIALSADAGPMRVHLSVNDSDAARHGLVQRRNAGTRWAITLGWVAK